MKKTAANKSAAVQARPRRRLAGRVRILPLTILALALLLGLKIGTLWEGRGELFVTAAGAQQAAPAQARSSQGQPTKLTPEKPAAEGQAAKQQQVAQGNAAPQAEAPKQPPAEQPPSANAAGASSAIQSLASRDPTTYTRSEIELLANLARRRDQLEQRSRELDMRESLLAAAEKRLDERIAALKKLEGSIKQIVQEHDQQEEKNLQGLVKVYENMKPKDAARIFEKLDSNVLLGVAERMKEAKLAAILADMDPAAAQDITVRLATRKLIPVNLRAGIQEQAASAAPERKAPAAAAGAAASTAGTKNPAKPATPGG
ncbi:MAG TPA: hypothetical protein VF194_01545 [Ferrovibrio sp.]|uniref:MotE family protein n=1 Tax=Ferrovibrio sp. TaxID=1917215 RepID=UPI002ED30A40